MSDTDFVDEDLFSEIRPKDLSKKIKGAAKALQNGRSTEDLLAKMVEKGTEEKTAKTLILILDEITSKNLIEDEERLDVLYDYGVPDKYLNCFINFDKEVKQGELLDKIRDKQGISTKARRKGTIKVGAIAMGIAGGICLISAFVTWQTFNNISSNPHAASNVTNESIVDFYITQNAVVGMLFLIFALAAERFPLESCLGGIAVFGLSTLAELIQTGTVLGGILVKIFIVVSLVYAINAARRQEDEDRTIPQNVS